MKKVLFFNPWSARYGWRIPNSILQVASTVGEGRGFTFVDGNREKDPWSKIKQYLDTGEYGYFGCTVMPGPQLKQAIPFTKKVKHNYPDITTIWGGYFASNQFKVSITSGFVDFIVDGPGDNAFPQLLNALETTGDLNGVTNLIYRKEDEIIRNPRETLLDPDQIPTLPYEKLDTFYSIKGYLRRSHLGHHTAAYHSSFGCPFTCSFCAVVPIYNARWKGRSASLVYNDIKVLIDQYGADAVEFHDNNFFVSEKRTVEFSKLIAPEKISWWGEGRIDTIDKYKDESLARMRDAGCKMIFFGAESGDDELLKKMDKGGTQTAAQMKRFAARMRKFGIIPEYSFVLGFPGETPEKVQRQIERDISFIKEIKDINPEAEIILYVYSPVATEGSELYNAVKASGFSFPQKLEDWLDPAWENFDLRKNPLTPWLTPSMIDKIKGFETVLNSYYPTASDFKLTRLQRTVMHALAMPRYKTNFFQYPYELKFLQKFWLRYRQPEIEGMYLE